MCGIAGLASLDGAEPSRGTLAAMSEAIRHRGPDEDGAYAAPGVALAIRRLKVIDLVTGGQPVFNEARDVAVVFNGEIYNYKELRAELQAKGHRFSTQGDTETLVHLYEEHGDDFLLRLNGMFALALWDDRRKRLLLACDPAGVKPLCYATVGRELRFASEVKGLLAAPGVSRAVDPQAFSDYLSFYYVPGPATFYADVRRLEPGHRLVVEGGAWRVERWWDLAFSPEPGRGDASWRDEFRAAWSGAVRRHLQSDVPVGVYLSGGLDSASIVAEASRLGGRLKTFSVGYAEASYSELEEARSVASRFGTDHSELVVTPAELREALPAAVAALDQPFGDWTLAPSYLLSAAARRSVTVVLTGAGGDELFAGYPTLFAARAAMAYRRLPAWLRRGVLAPAVRRLPTSYERMSLDFVAKAFVDGADLPLERAHLRFKEVFDEAGRRALAGAGAGWPSRAREPFAAFERHAAAYGPMGWMDRLMYLDFKVFLADDILPIGDLTTAAHSLEGRVPFLDLEMLRLAARMPAAMKLRGLTTKRVLREAMAGVLPERVLRMRKKGFLVPSGPWLRGELRGFVSEAARGAEERLGRVLDFGAVRRLLDDHFEGRRDNARRITCLTSLFLWDRQARPDWGAFA